MVSNCPHEWEIKCIFIRSCISYDLIVFVNSNALFINSTEIKLTINNSFAVIWKHIDHKENPTHVYSLTKSTWYIT